MPDLRALERELARAEKAIVKASERRDRLLREVELHKAATLFRETWGGALGIVGVGVTADGLIVYLLNQRGLRTAKKNAPKWFGEGGFPVEYRAHGPVVPAGRKGRL